MNNLTDKNKTTYDDLWRGNESFPPTTTQKTTIYISEAGLYQLIMSSKLPSAVKVQDWVFDDLLPKIRRVGQEKYIQEIRAKELVIEEKESLIEEKENQIRQMDDERNRLHLQNRELMTCKLLKERNEIVYIVATHNYARQGIFKVGKTKSMKSRNSGHNNTHVSGDKVKVLAQFRVNNATLTEGVIHKKLEGIALPGEKEKFMCPYDLLYNIVDLMVNHDEEANQVVNALIESVYKLKRMNFRETDWTSGLDMSIFKEQMFLVEDTEQVVAFDITTATREQKQTFISGCIDVYIRSIVQPQQPNDIQFEILWKNFQVYLISQLGIPRSKFKAKEWKEYLKTEQQSNNKIAIKWRDP